MRYLGLQHSKQDAKEKTVTSFEKNVQTFPVGQRKHSTGKCGAFVERHIGPRKHQQKEMLHYLNFETFSDMVNSIIPNKLLQNTPLDIEDPLSEEDLIDHMRNLSQENVVVKSFIGQGYYGTFTPSVIKRNVLENPGWYTAYTPYQAELSQGRLEAIANFQTMVAELTRMEIANASLLDEGTAAAEAMALCARVAKRKETKTFFISKYCHPQTIDVVVNRAKYLGIETVIGDEDSGLPQDLIGALFQYPRTLGHVNDYTKAIKDVHDGGGLAVIATDLLALTLLKTPKRMDADIAVGSSQRFGVPMGFGGPHAAFFATRKRFERSIPGRIIGVSIDRFGQPAYRMALQTREQHIRRDKATSNICTAQSLLAIMAGFYGVYHGPEGLKAIALRVHGLVATLAMALERAGYKLVSKCFFDTLAIRVEGRARRIVNDALKGGYNIRFVDADTVSIAFDETTNHKDLEAMLAVFDVTLSDGKILMQNPKSALPSSMMRTTNFMQQGVFNVYRSETEMMRYTRHLVDKDISLDKAMIPLGSCTMKLNAASEMESLGFSGFSDLHPFAPVEQTKGYRRMIATLERWLCSITGYDAMSMQPNAGSQGEYAGLLAIRRYHESRGEGLKRRICLIPTSAHGTNPASARMANMDVVPISCDDLGNISLDDVKEKCQLYNHKIAAVMITYPSTHGVFEEDIVNICDIVHAVGGQVYIDGANLNAQVGLVAPGEYGGDVSHLNLHKTFAIPHGGGGPGVGPIGVKAHLAPFLPGHSIVDNGRGRQGAVASSPFGSASILTISYAYIALLGDQGLRLSTQQAILSANYIAKKLEPYYPILYNAKTGFVAHECIIDIRPFEKETGISAEDVAKRLMDYSFHAPTMSFPVPGTLMIEPTESESLEEIERFITAMVQIYREIQEVQEGRADSTDNVLKNAPHTAYEAISGDWQHPYTREKAIYPHKSLRSHKIWPSVGRIDNVYGDRNLFCSCIPMRYYTSEDYLYEQMHS